MRDGGRAELERAGAGGPTRVCDNLPPTTYTLLSAPSATSSRVGAHIGAPSA
jgi:hypothetical protein